jgi:hypothetical protein
MNFEDFRERLQRERSRRAQRDAAERRLPVERLRREIREAFARERARELPEDHEVRVESDPLQPPHAER